MIRALRPLVCLLVVAATVLARAPGGLAASAGSLDLSFGSGGTTALTDSQGLGFDAAVRLPDGGMVVALSKGMTAPQQVTLIKVGPEGMVDPQFEQDGFAAASWVLYPMLFDLALMPDGRIVAVGMAAEQDGGYAWLIARFDADGSLDASFGSDGVVDLPMPGGAAATAVALQPDGRIVAGGERYGDSGYQEHWALARLDADGSLDASFGAGGITILPFQGSSLADLALQPDGKVVATGEDVEGGNPAVNVVARFEPDGQIDNTYGTDGVTSLPGVDGDSLVVDGEGRVVLAGRVSGPAGTGSGLARLDPNGVPDATFGSGGVTTPLDPGQPVWANAVAVQADGRILASGDTIGPTGGYGFALTRYTSDGNLDPAFGDDGRVLEDVYPGHPSNARAVAIQPDGRILAVGTADDLQNHPMTLLQRFFATDAPSTTIDDGPAGTVGSPDVAFSFSSSVPDATFACSLDASAYASCSSPTSYSGLADGNHSFSVRATDAAHNVGPPASRSFTVDTVHVPRPDALIGVGAHPPVGNDVFNTTGRHQRAEAKVPRGTSKAFHIVIQNDGNANDRFGVYARASMQGCVLTYSEGGLDVTGSIADGSFTTATLAPGQSLRIDLLVTAKLRAALGPRNPLSVVVRSRTDGLAEDVVAASVDVVA